MPSRSLAPIALIVFVDVLGFTVVIPLLPFQAQALGASPMVIGLLLSTYALCGLFAAPALGRWSDRLGRKPVLLLSQAGSCAGFVLLALAPSLPWLFAARALDGITSGNVAVARAFIADVTPPRERSAAFGVIAAAFGFGFLVGPASAAFLSGVRADLPFWVAAGLSAASMVLTAIVLPSAVPAQPAPAVSGADLPTLRQPRVVARLAQLFGFLFAFSAFNAGFALFCERRFAWDGTAFGPREVGFLLAFSGGLALMGQLFALRRLTPRFGEPRIVKACLAAGVLAYAAIGGATALPALLAALGCLALANSLLRPCLLGVLSLEVPPHRQGAIFGLTQSLQSAAYLAGPLLAGSLIQGGWLGAWALACAAILAGALLLTRIAETGAPRSQAPTARDAGR